jgi:hypothetical protein
VTDPIQIVIIDGIAQSIAPGLNLIATAADLAATSTEQLQAQVAKFGGLTGAASISLTEYENILANMSRGNRELNASLLSVEQTQTHATASLRGYTEAQIELFRAQQEGLNFQKDLNASFALTGKSAKESAAAFTEQAAAAEQAAGLINGYTEAQLALMRAQQDGANFLRDLNEQFRLNDTVVKSAAESAKVMAAALDAEDAAFAAVAVSLAEHNAAITDGTDLALTYRATLLATAEAEAALAAGADVATVAVIKANTAFGSLFKAAAAFFAITEVIQAVDGYTKLSNAITIAGLSGDKAASEFHTLTDIAIQNGIAVDNVAGLYNKLAVANSILGLDQDKTNTLVKELAQSFRIQGLSAQQTTNTLRDFVDIIETSGTKFTRYFANLQRADFALVGVAAKGLGLSIEELDKKVLAGTLTGKDFAEGIIKGSTAMNELAAQTHVTVSGALTDLNTGFVQLIEDTDHNTGALFLLAQTIQFLATNLGLVATGVLLFGVSWGYVKFVALIGGVYELTKALLGMEVIFLTLGGTITISAISIIALVAVFVLGAYAVAAMTGKVDELNNSIKGAAGAVGNFVGGAITPMLNAFKSAIGVTDLSSAAFAGFGSSAGDAAGGVSSLGKQSDAAKTATEKLQTQIDNMNKSVTTTTDGTDGLNSSVTKTTQAFLGANGSIDKFTTTTNRAADGTASVSKQMQLLSKGVGSAGGLSSSFDSAAASTSNAIVKIISVTPAMTAADEAMSSFANTAQDLGDALSVDIIRADGTTASLVKFSDQAYAAARATDTQAAAVQTLSDRLSALSQYKAAAPGLFNDPSNDNGNFTNITGNHSDNAFQNDPAPAFASGGSFIVGGSPGVDTNQVRFKASRGERVTIQTPTQMKASNTHTNVAHVTMIVYANDANSFRASRAQIARETGSAIQAGMSNG